MLALPLIRTLPRAAKSGPFDRVVKGCLALALLSAAASGSTVFAQIPEAAPPWATDLLGRVAKVEASRLPPHPRLLLSDANVAHMREVAQSPFGARYVKVVADWLEKERALPPMEDPAAQKKTASGARDMDEFRRIQAAAEAVESHLVLTCGMYRITGEQKYLEQARAWVHAVSKWNPHGATGIKSDDYAARQTLHALAIAYDGLYAVWTPEERGQIREAIAARGDALWHHLDPFKQDAYNNHPWFQTSALVDAGLALADESAEADRWWRYGAELYFTRFLPIGGNDGSWHEGINYLTFTMKYVCHFATSLAGATGIDPFATVPWLRNAGYFRLYLAPPNSIGVYFNDTRPLAIQQWDKPTAFRIAGETQDPILEWYAEWLPQTSSQPTSSFYTLLYRDPKLPAKAPSSLPLNRFFADTGWAVSRTDLTDGRDVQFGFKSQPWGGPPSRALGHDHPDANNFLLNFLGKPLLVDSGYYDYYSSPHHKGWTMTGRAHNTLLVDGQGQLTRSPGRVLAFSSQPGAFDWMEGEGATAYPSGLLKSWRRQVLYLRPDLFVVRDIVRLAKPATLTWLLHGAARFELDGQAFACRNDDAAVTGAVIAPKNLQVKQWFGFPEGAEPERKTAADREQFPDQAHLELSSEGRVSEATFVTVFAVGRANDLKRPIAELASSPEGDTITIGGEGRSRVQVRLAPAPADGSPAPQPVITR